MTDHIQIGDIAPRIQYVANGAQTQFTYPFPIFVAADLEVYLSEAKQSSGHTVAGAGQSAGGSVTFTVAPTNGAVVTLRRCIAIKRTSDFQESGEFRAKVINDELDYQTAALQQIADDGTRSLQLAATDTGANLTLPVKAARAGMYLGFDANGDLLASSGTGATPPISAFAATLIDDADAAAARATLGLGTAAVKNAAGGSGDLLPANGDGSALTNLPLDAALATDIRLLALETAALKGDRLNMANGWSDPLKDETDIETAQNVNAIYVSTGGGYYHNLAVVAVPQATGTAIGDMISGGGLAAAFDGISSQAQAVSAYVGAATGAVGKDWGVGVTKKIGRFIAVSPNNAGWSGGTDTINNVKLQGSSDGSSWTDLYATGAFTDANGHTVDVSSGIATSTAYRYHRLYVDTAASSAGCAELTFYEISTPDNMTVISKQVVAAASAPTIGRLHVQIKDITGGSTVNTDFKGHVSRDNGTTYTQGTLALVQTLADATKAYEFDSLDISAQPSGTAPRFKFTTHNNKEIQLHGAVVQWK